MHSQPRRPSDSLIDPDDLDNNHSANTSVHDVLRERLHRRHLLKGGVSALTFAGLGGLSLSACGGSDNPAPTPVPVKSLGFTAVSKDLADQLVLAPGYTASVIYATGDAISSTVGDYKNDGSDDTFSKRSGDHHDGMHYFGLAATGATPDKTSTDRALLAMNHENIAGTVQFMHPAGQTNLSATSAAGRPEAEAVKEIEAHGVSIVEIKKTGGKFATVKASLLNRRITASTPMEINGPVRGSALVKTKYSAGGTMTRGTLNNCASGYTPWGTYLTCEENWAGYFKRAATDDANRSAKEITAFKRVGLNQGNGGNNRWTSVVPADAASTEFSRWDASKLGASTDGTDDFRNAANTFGWVVEIDPYNTASTPRKRTALGRFAHEGAWPSLAVVGKPLAFYMGDDSRGEYIYKFVSNAMWSAADATGGLAAGDKYLDNGTLYAAKFNADGTGTWLKLDISNIAIASAAAYAFADQADVLVNARLAADAAGATKMDRPEWTAVNPANGEVYITCTENPDRANLGAVNGNNNPNPAADAANPRYWLDKKNGTSNQRGNVNGHIMRVRETGNDTSATTFNWDIFLFGAQAKADAGLDDVHYQKNVNLSGLSDFNDLSKPDGCWFSPTSGILWIQTDDNTYTDVSNCMLLAAIPGTMGDGGEIDVVNKADGSSAATPPAGDVTIKTRISKKLGDTQFKRFLTAPRGAEVTGLAASPDGKALFINIQHPGENTTAAMFTAGSYDSNWPGNGKGVAAYGPGGATARPRSATVMITKDDGGTIGL
jgi:uncharacterized protein